MAISLLRLIICGVIVAGASAELDIKQINECENVGKKFSDMGIGHAITVPTSKIHDDEMEICYHGGRDIERTSCCTRAMERKYHAAAMRDYRQTVTLTAVFLSQMLEKTHKQAQDEFAAMLAAAQNATEAVFASDFSLLPAAARRRALDGLFTDLAAYVRGRDVDVREAVATFFSQLFPAVVEKLVFDGSKMELTDDYRDCLSESRQTLIPRPFGDASNSLGAMLSENLELARLYIEAIQLGIESLNTTSHVHLDLQCSRAVTRLTYCAHCDGHTDVRPCPGLCHNVFRGCLQPLSELDSLWSGYVDGVDLLAATLRRRLPDPRAVATRAAAGVAEAIMHAMDTAPKYITHMIKRCGELKDQIVSTKEPAGAASRITLARLSPAETEPQNAKNTDAPSDLIRDLDAFVSNLMASKGFYRQLTEAVCTNDKFSAAGRGEPCWNGETVGTYDKEVPDSSPAAQKRNPEVQVSPVRPQALVSLADKLHTMKKKLSQPAAVSSFHALDHDDDEMMQGDDWSVYQASGYDSDYRGNRNRGKGYRRGHGMNTVDDEDYQDDYSGSGSGSHPNYHKYNVNKPNRKPGAKSPSTNDDMYLEDEKPDPPYVTEKPQTDNYQGGSTATHVQASVVMTTLVVALVCWR